jgi:hypothetical protein
VGTGVDPATAVVGRPLADGSWALGFFNAGNLPSDVTCDAACLVGMGWEPTQNFHVRDLPDEVREAKNRGFSLENPSKSRFSKKLSRFSGVNNMKK